MRYILICYYFMITQKLPFDTVIKRLLDCVFSFSKKAGPCSSKALAQVTVSILLFLYLCPLMEVFGSLTTEPFGRSCFLYVLVFKEKKKYCDVFYALCLFGKSLVLAIGCI